MADSVSRDSTRQGNRGGQLLLTLSGRGGEDGFAPCHLVEAARGATSALGMDSHVQKARDYLQKPGLAKPPRACA